MSDDETLKRIEEKLDLVLGILSPPKVIDVKDSVQANECKHRNRTNITTFGMQNTVYYCRDCKKMVEGPPFIGEPGSAPKEGA